MEALLNSALFCGVPVSLLCIVIVIVYFATRKGENSEHQR